MPLSIVLNLSTQESLPKEHLGRQAQAWFLAQMEQIDPALSQELHDHNGYTVSGLFYKVAQSEGINNSRGAKGKISCCLRITCVSDYLEEALDEWLKKKIPAIVKLWWLELKIDSFTLDSRENPWAGRSSYAELMRQAQENCSRDLSLEFASLTGFRSNGKDICSPTPFYVFRSHFEKWNRFAPKPAQIQDIWPQFVYDCISIRQIRNLNTSHIKFADGAKGGATGFTGQVSYALLPIHQCEKWAEAWNGAGEILQTLGRYAFYCGTGHHSAIGLGQTRPITMPKTKRYDID